MSMWGSIRDGHLIHASSDEDDTGAADYEIDVAVGPDGIRLCAWPPRPAPWRVAMQVYLTPTAARALADLLRCAAPPTGPDPTDPPPAAPAPAGEPPPSVAGTPPDPADRRHVCPECGEPAVRRPPAGRWAATTLAVTGRLPAWSHTDGEPLCPVTGPDGAYRPADPTPLD